MVYVFLAEGFEQMEAMCPIDLLRRAGIEVVTVGVTGREVKSANGVSVIADIRPEEMCMDQAEMIFLPGGLPGAAYLSQSPDVKDAIAYAMSNDLYIAAICAAPFVLAEQGVLQGKRATCYPGKDPVLAAGGATVCLEENLVVEGKVITAKAAGSSIELGLTLCRLLRGEEAAKQVAQDIFYGC